MITISSRHRETWGCNSATELDGEEGEHDVYLLAHPDDEIFIYSLITRAIRQRRDVSVIYLTNGNARGRCDPDVRRTETMSALNHAGVGAQRVHFVGIECNFADGTLITQLDTALARTTDILERLTNPTRVISHSWEAGHPDHDAAHLVAMAIADRFACWHSSLVFSAYRTSLCQGLPFVVGIPLAVNGAKCSLRLSTNDSLQTIGAMRFYPSQISTFLALAPGLIWKFGLAQTICLQRLADSCAPRKPIQTRTLTERRFGTQWDAFEEAARAFMKRRDLPLQ